MRRGVQFVIVVLLAAGVSTLILPPPSVSQPLPFNHAKHTGLTCSACHAGVTTTARAQLPAPAVCAKCHATAPVTVAEADWERLQSIGVRFWTPVTKMPDHVMFSHRRHVTLAGLACASCHGDIGQRTTPPGRMPVRLVMNTCLGCHRAEGASEDCTECHR